MEYESELDNSIRPVAADIFPSWSREGFEVLEKDILHLFNNVKELTRVSQHPNESW